MGKQNLGVKEKCPKVTYLIFFDGVPLENFSFYHGLIDFVLFLILAWRILESFIVSVSLLSLARIVKWLSSVCHETCSKTSFLYLLPLRGREPHFRLGSPPYHLLSFFFPLPMSGDPRSLKCEHLRDPHSLLTLTF